MDDWIAMSRQRLSRLPYRGWVGALIAFAAVGCDGRQVQTPKPAAQPPSQPVTSMPASAPAIRDGSGIGDAHAITKKPTVEVKPKPAVPKRPESTWALFREAFDPASDALCEARYSGGNRLDVTTENISHMTLDLQKLPEGAPTKGPWNLQIDGQGIEVSGSRGRYLHLIRGKAGAWDVDRAAYRK